MKKLTDQQVGQFSLAANILAGVVTSAIDYAQSKTDDQRIQAQRDIEKSIRDGLIAIAQSDD